MQPILTSAYDTLATDTIGIIKNIIIQNGSSSIFTIITALSATVIAVLSLVVSITQLILTKKHYNRLIMPKLMLTKHLGRYEDKIGILLENVGVGPGIVDEISVYYNQEIVDNVRALREKIKLTFDRNFYFIDYRKYDTIRAGGNDWLVSTSADDFSRDQLEELKNELKKINIVIEYSSVTNKKGTADANHS